FGSVRHVLQVPPATRSFVDLPTAGAMRTSLAEVLWEGPSGVHVLLAPGKAEEVDLIQGGDIGSAMNMLAESHTYVIVDTHSRLAEDALPTLDAAKLSLMIGTCMKPSLRKDR